METKNQIIISIFAVSMILFAGFFHGAVIQAISGLQYPVQELGGCKSEADCKNYCDDTANSEKCLDYALQKGLMSAEEIQVARKFLTGNIKGPGGCTDKKSCENYCDNIDNINVCVAFVEENNFLSSEELQEFKQVQSAIERGVKPPPCKNKQECELYCEEPGNMKECIHFGREAGFLQGEELKDAQKMLQAIERGLTPPPCRGRNSCQQYCSNPKNMEMCMDFALEAGFMTDQEKTDAQKMLNALKKGVKPLSCQGKEECDAYCSLDEHFEECLSFAEAADFMTTEEAFLARKTGGKGPGGCKGKEECEAFCQNPDNQEMCFNFAKEHGMIPAEEMRQAEEGMQQLRQNLGNMPSEVTECLKNKISAEEFEKIQNGGTPSEAIGEHMKSCFTGQGERQDRRQMPLPSGVIPECQTPEECEKFRMMGGERIRQEMMNPQGSQIPTGISPEEYQRQYEEQYKQQLQQNQVPEGVPQQPTSFLSNTLLGSLIYSLFNFLFNR